MSTWEKYRDMIDLPYPGESKHTRMPVRDRAAQFAPFAALTGFGAVLKETERITEKRIELDEYEKEKLNENLRLLLEKQESRPEITVTFFVPDDLRSYKESGRGESLFDFRGRGKNFAGRYF